MLFRFDTESQLNSLILCTHSLTVPTAITWPPRMCPTRTHDSIFPLIKIVTVVTLIADANQYCGSSTQRFNRHNKGRTTSTILSCSMCKESQKPNYPRSSLISSSKLIIGPQNERLSTYILHTFVFSLP